MKRFLILIVTASLAILWAAARPQEPAEPGFDHEHKQWTSVLAAVVRSGRVDYAALAANRGVFDQYLAKLSSQDSTEFAQWSKSERFAFWINAYNAFTMQAVLANYPFEEIESLRDVGGTGSGKAWLQRDISLGRLIAGHSRAELSLDEILNLVLREQFEDARVHAALCNSCLGSPALRPAAFGASELEKQLDAAARAWLGDVSRTKFSKESKQVEASQIFDAFRADFIRDAGSVDAWITRYAPLNERTWIDKSGFERKTLAFDWKLNDVEREER